MIAAKRWSTRRISRGSRRGFRQFVAESVGRIGLFVSSSESSFYVESDVSATLAISDILMRAAHVSDGHHGATGPCYLFSLWSCSMGQVV